MFAVSIARKYVRASQTLWNARRVLPLEQFLSKQYLHSLLCRGPTRDFDKNPLPIVPRSLSLFLSPASRRQKEASVDWRERDTHRKELTSKIEASCWVIVISDALKTSIYVIFKRIVWFSVTRTVHTNQTGGSWGESKQFLRSEFSILNAQVLDPQNTDISHLISNFCKRTAEERRREKFCDKRDNIFTLL